MSVTFAVPKSALEPTWVPIDLGGGSSIEIAIKSPTLEDQLEALAEVRGLSMTAFQLRSHITGWRGVIDASGAEVPYSWDMLNSLCTSFPYAVLDLTKAVREALYPSVADPASGDPAKNSETPPANGGAETIGEIAVLTPSSPDMSSSSEPSGLPRGSD